MNVLKRFLSDHIIDKFTKMQISCSKYKKKRLQTSNANENFIQILHLLHLLIHDLYSFGIIHLFFISSSTEHFFH